MTFYTWEHLLCNGCGMALTTSSTMNGKKLPGTKTATQAGWVRKVATASKPRRDYCPACIKKGLAK